MTPLKVFSRKFYENFRNYLLCRTPANGSFCQKVPKNWLFSLSFFRVQRLMFTQLLFWKLGTENRKALAKTTNSAQRKVYSYSAFFSSVFYRVRTEFEDLQSKNLFEYEDLQVKSPYSDWMRENTKQANPEYVDFPRSGS